MSTPFRVLHERLALTFDLPRFKWNTDDNINMNNNNNNMNVNMNKNKIIQFLDLPSNRYRIAGYAELLILPILPNFIKKNGISLHCRQCRVTGTEINSVATKYTLHNYLGHFSNVKATQKHLYTQQQQQHENYEGEPRDFLTLCAHARAASEKADKGELYIAWPEMTFVKAQNTTTTTKGNNNLGEYAPVLVRVHFEVVSPRGGLFFQYISNNNQQQEEDQQHVYTQDRGECNIWFPCSNGPLDRCTWDLDFTVPPGNVAIVSGSLITLPPPSLARESAAQWPRYNYSITVPTTPSSIGLVVGPFQMTRDPTVSSILHFSLVNTPTEVISNTTSFLAHAFRFYEDLLECKFPYDWFSQVFVSSPATTMNSFAGMCIYNKHLLHGKEVLDEAPRVRSKLSLGLATQFFRHYLGPKSIQHDLWISYGLSIWLSNQFISRLFGDNALQMKLTKQIHELHQHEWLIPLSVPAGRNSDVTVGSFGTLGAGLGMSRTESRHFALRAGLVMYALEKRVGASAFLRVVRNLLKPPSPDRPIRHYLSTHTFLRELKEAAGSQDLRLFTEQWIYGRGTPPVLCSFWFDRKHHRTEVAIKQDISPLWLGSTSLEKLTGSLSVRINEAEGTYDHTINFDSQASTHEFACFSRARKARKRKIRNENGEEVSEPVENAKRAETPVLWVRIDPEFECIGKISFRQSESMWISQLEMDKDVRAQYESVCGLSHFFTKETVQTLVSVLHEPQVYWPIRVEAAFVLAHTCCARTDYAGLNHLQKFFRYHFFDRQSETQMMANDFSDLVRYQLQKAIPLAISEVRTETGYSPEDAIVFLLNLVRNVDNSASPYTDSFYVASMLTALGKLKHGTPLHVKKVVKQLQHYILKEELVPSYHGIVLAAALRSLSNLQLSGAISLDISLFWKYTVAFLQCDTVRLCAFECIAKVDLHGQFHRLLEVIHKDPSPRVRLFLASHLRSLPRSYYEKFQLDNENAAHIHQLWYLITEGLGYDFPLRIELAELYRHIWGTGTPLVLWNDANPMLSIQPRNGKAFMIAGTNTVRVKRRKKGPPTEGSSFNIFTTGVVYHSPAHSPGTTSPGIFSTPASYPSPVPSPALGIFPVYSPPVYSCEKSNSDIQVDTITSR